MPVVGAEGLWVSPPIGGGASFAPTDFPGALLWLRADLGITTSGGFVTAWADQTSNHNNYVSPGGSQPIVGMMPNGKAAIIASAGTELNSAAWEPDGAKTVAFVFQITTLPTAGQFQSVISLKSVTPLFSEFFFSALGGAYQPYSFAFDFTNTTALGFAAALDTNPHILIIDWDGVTAHAFLDGNAKLVVASGADIRNTNDLSSLLSRVNSGGITSASLFGNFAEEVVYNRVLTAAERDTLTFFWKQYYSIP